MTRNTLLISGLILALFGALAYTALSPSVEKQDGGLAAGETRGYSGIIDSISLQDGYITVRATASSTEPAVAKVVVDQNADIRTIMIQKNKDGKTEEQLLEKINMGGLVRGDKVDIEYVSQYGTTLGGVTSITATRHTADMDAYIKKKTSASENPFLFIRARLASADTSAMTLNFNLYNFDTVSTTTQSITLAKEVPVYSIANVADLFMERARVAASFTELVTGSDIYFLVDKAAFKGAIQSPVSIILIKK